MFSNLVWNAESTKGCQVVTKAFKWFLRTLKSLISMEFFLFFLRKFYQLHALLEPSRLLISEKSASNTAFYLINMKKSHLHALI